MLPRIRRAPVEGPEHPRELLTLSHGECSRLPVSFVDAHLHPGDRCTPGSAHDSVAVAIRCDFGRSRLETVLLDRSKSPDRLPVDFLFPDGDVIAGHEVALVA